jgi:ABC-type transporter Mla subunit MlaD
MDTHNRDELIGRIYRQKTEHRKRLAFIDAELSDAAEAFKTAASQLQCLLAGERSDLESALSKLDVDRVLKLLAEREQIYRRIAEANQQLKQLGVR